MEAVLFDFVVMIIIGTGDASGYCTLQLLILNFFLQRIARLIQLLRCVHPRKTLVLVSP